MRQERVLPHETSPQGLSLEARDQLRSDIVAHIDETWGTHYERRRQQLAQYADAVVAEGTDDQVAAAAEIVLVDTLDGYPIPKLIGKGAGVYGEMDRVQQFIGITMREPGLARSIARNNVVGFHASNSSSLLSVLQHGLLSATEARQRNIPLGAGERTYPSSDAPFFVSFAHWQAWHTLARYSGDEQPMTLWDYDDRIWKLKGDLAWFTPTFGDTHPWAINWKLQIEDTARLVVQLNRDPDSPESRLIMDNFPVLYGFNATDYPQEESELSWNRSSTHKVLLKQVAASDVSGEFAVINGRIPPQEIPIIAVPQHHVDRIHQLVHETGYAIDVYPIDSLVMPHNPPASASNLRI